MFVPRTSQRQTDARQLVEVDPYPVPLLAHPNGRAFVLTLIGTASATAPVGCFLRLVGKDADFLDEQRKELLLFFEGQCPHELVEVLKLPSDQAGIEHALGAVLNLHVEFANLGFEHLALGL